MKASGLAGTVARLTAWQVYAGGALALAAAWSAVWRADGAQGVAEHAAGWYPLLGLILPLLLIVTVNVLLSGPARPCFASLNRAVLVCMASGLAGWLGATLVFLVLASQIPAIFGGESASELVTELRPRLFLRPITLVAGGSLAGGAVAAVMTWMRVRR